MSIRENDTEKNQVVVGRGGVVVCEDKNLLRLRLTPILGVREHLTLLQLCLFPWA
jgi:RNase P/RNase MRP subunit p29